MKNTTRKSTTQQPKPYHSQFGSLGRDVDLGIGILIAEAETGQYEVLGPVSTINEGIEIARHDYRHRIKTLDQGGDDPERAIVRVCGAREEHV